MVAETDQTGELLVSFLFVGPSPAHLQHADLALTMQKTRLTAQTAQPTKPTALCIFAVVVTPIQCMRASIIAT